MKDNIEVSIICCTYNQDSYISKSIEGFLMQKTNFKYEILIHDDCSTDNTINILKEFENKYPDKIFVYYEKENQYSKGVNIFSTMLEKARGKYVAICEGDDYWFDDNKLQIQYNFLESHLDCGLVTTNAKIFDENKQSFYKQKNPYNHSRFYSTDEVIMYDGDLFATCTMFFKNDKLSLPDFYFNAPVGDYPLTIYLSLIGKVYFINKCTSVYRKNAKGSWTKSMKKNYLDNKKKLFIGLSNMFNEINIYTDNKYKKSTEYVLLKREFELLCLEEKYSELKDKKFKKLYKIGNLKTRLKFFVKVKFNKIYTSYKKH